MEKYNKKLYDNLANRIARRLLWLFEWFCDFVINGVRYGYHNIKVSKFRVLRKNKNLVILANGPSLQNSYDSILKHKNCDYFCVNYFPTKSEWFDQLKPRFMALTDVMFFDKNYPLKEKIKETEELKEKLEQIDWDMIIFTRRDMSLQLKNSHIKEIRMNTNQIDGVYSKFRGLLFDLDFAVPRSYTVASYAILAGIKMKYKYIYVYGIDNSMHENVKVNEKNETVSSIKHFYKAKETTIDIGEVLMMTHGNIVGYRMLNQYAKSRNVTIINCTKDSYVDAFKRL